MPRSSSTRNTCYITALYNFPLWLASHPVGQWVSHLSSSRPACLAPLWQPLFSAHMYVCYSPGWGVSHLQANYGRYLFSGRNKKPSDRILSSFILDSILVCWVMSWFLGSKDFTSCLEINLNASWLFRGETYRTAGMPCYSRSAFSPEHMWSLYIYTYDL